MAVRQIPPNLLHPGLVRVGRVADKAYASRGKLHGEEHVECDQPCYGSNLDRSEVNGAQYVRMGSEEFFPSSLPSALRSRLDPTAKLRSELGLVSLVSLIPSLKPRY